MWIIFVKSVRFRRIACKDGRMEVQKDAWVQVTETPRGFIS